MQDTKIRSCVNDPHQRFIYIFDYSTQWTLLCELISIEESSEKQTYPRIYRTEGKAPRQHNEGKFKMLDDNEFDTLAEKILAAKGIKSLLVEHEEELWPKTTMIWTMTSRTMKTKRTTTNLVSALWAKALMPTI